jgi:hypothetical protein
MEKIEENLRKRLRRRAKLSVWVGICNFYHQAAGRSFKICRILFYRNFLPLLKTKGLTI